MDLVNPMAQYLVLKPKLGDTTIKNPLEEAEQAEDLYRCDKSGDYQYYKAGPPIIPTPIDSNIGNREFEPPALDYPYYSAALGYEIAEPDAEYLNHARLSHEDKDDDASLNPEAAALIHEAASFAMNPTAPVFVPGQQSKSPPAAETPRLTPSTAQRSIPTASSGSPTPRARSSQLGKSPSSARSFYDFPDHWYNLQGDIRIRHLISMKGRLVFHQPSPVSNLISTKS